jgi:hypothetical protein
MYTCRSLFWHFQHFQHLWLKIAKRGNLGKNKLKPFFLMLL